VEKLDVKTLSCAECGLATSPQAMVYAAVGRDARDAEGNPLVLEQVFCSKGCYQASLSAQLQRLHCRHCGTAFDRPQTMGRRPAYCSPVCRKARERVLDRAWKNLAKGAASDPRQPSSATPQALAKWRQDLVDRHTELVILVEHWNTWRHNRLAPDEGPVPKAAAESARDVTRAMERASQRLTDLIHEAGRQYDNAAAEDRRQADARVFDQAFNPSYRRRDTWTQALAGNEDRAG